MKWVKCLACGKKIKIPSWYNVLEAWFVDRLDGGSDANGGYVLGGRYGRFVVCPCGGATCLCKDYKKVKKMLEDLKDDAG